MCLFSVVVAWLLQFTFCWSVVSVRCGVVLCSIWRMSHVSVAVGARWFVYDSFVYCERWFLLAVAVVGSIGVWLNSGCSCMPRVASYYLLTITHLIFRNSLCSLRALHWHVRGLMFDSSQFETLICVYPLCWYVLLPCCAGWLLPWQRSVLRGSRMRFLMFASAVQHVAFHIEVQWSLFVCCLVSLRVSAWSVAVCFIVSKLQLIARSGLLGATELLLFFAICFWYPPTDFSWFVFVYLWQLCCVNIAKSCTVVGAVARVYSARCWPQRCASWSHATTLFASRVLYEYIHGVRFVLRVGFG